MADLNNENKITELVKTLLDKIHYEEYIKDEAETDEEATKYYKECERILCETAANVYIQDLAELVVLNKKYAGYEFYPMYLQDLAKLYIVQ